ncbi:MAG: hypothetical protein AB7G13_15740 [Lautropia sp.]
MNAIDEKLVPLGTEHAPGQALRQRGALQNVGAELRDRPAGRLGRTAEVIGRHREDRRYRERSR